jgi:hypothetical protein
LLEDGGACFDGRDYRPTKRTDYHRKHRDIMVSVAAGLALFRVEQHHSTTVAKTAKVQRQDRDSQHCCRFDQCQDAYGGRV